MRHSLLPLFLMSSPVFAQTPQAVTDIAPVHSIVAAVMDGVGSPALVIPPGASPHGYAMRPSEARALAGADLVVWVGHGLTPWLEEPIETLAEQAQHLELTEIDGMVLMPFRAGEAFGAAHDHGHEDHADAEDAHDDHEDHAEAAHEEEHHEDEHHDAGGMDPHLWLDPVNGATAAVAIAIAQVLSELDPVNSEKRSENAKAFSDRLTNETAVLTKRLSPVAGRPFIVFHDAFRYFEARFDVEATASVSAGSAAKPGAARIAQVRADVTKAQAVCAFSEPQLNTDVLATVIEGQGTRIAKLDPLGATLSMGPDLYPQLLQDIATAMVDCLTP